MGLDFGQTCPDIDRSIGGFKSDVRLLLDDLVSDLCPILGDEVKDGLLNDYSDDIYSCFEDSFELVRKTNENMREEADHQIDLLTDEVGDLESQVKDLLYENEELTKIIETH